MSAQPASAIRHFLAFDYGLKRVVWPQATA